MRLQAEAFFQPIIYGVKKVKLFFNLQLCLFAILLSSNPLAAQVDSAVATTDSVKKDTFINVAVQPQTPFKVAEDSVIHPSEKLIPQLKQTLERYPNYYLYIFIGCFVLLAVIRLVTPSYLKELMLSVLNLRLLLNIYKEGRFDWNINNFLLDVVSVLMFSMGIHQALYAAQPEIFVWVLAFTAMGYFMKLILIQLLANIFFGRGEALVHLLMHTLFTRIAGLILLPVLFAGLYQTQFPLAQLLLILAYVLVASYALWLVRAYVKMKSISTGGMFYLFLYLCTIEISPIIILLKEVFV